MDTHSANQVKAFQIFSRYENVKELSATNGEVYAGPAPDSVTPEDRNKLKTYGWMPKGVDSTFVYNPK